MKTLIWMEIKGLKQEILKKESKCYVLLSVPSRSGKGAPLPLAKAFITGVYLVRKDLSTGWSLQQLQGVGLRLARGIGYLRIFRTQLDGTKDE